MIEVSLMVFTILVILATTSVFELFIISAMYEKYNEMKKLNKEKDIFKKSPNEPTIVYENGRQKYLYRPYNKNKGKRKSGKKETA